MKLLFAASALAVCCAAVAGAATPYPLQPGLRCAVGGLSRVATSAARCCAPLPCRNPLSFDAMPPPRHAAHT